jgi:hypothetical protein
MGDLAGSVLGADGLADMFELQRKSLCEEFERRVRAMVEVTPGALIELMDGFLAGLIESVPEASFPQIICEQTLVTNYVSVEYIVTENPRVSASSTTIAINEQNKQTIYLERGNYSMKLKLQHYLIPYTSDI